ncbi:MAG: bifunctional riboflavin kinase/FAD synthetase [Flavipsychrobacter sp.]
MAVFYSTDALPEFKNPVITIGTFDGVHMGHKTILNKVKEIAEKVDGTSILITFNPHPRKVIFPYMPMQILTPLDEKIKHINAEGIEHIIIAPFTKEFAQLSAEAYIKDFLVGQIKPHTIVIGYDHQFGHDRKGDITLLKKLSSTYNYQVEEIEAQLIKDAAVSSTKIRAALLEGDVEHAANMLEYDYKMKGTVEKGAQLGRTIGYPTANVTPETSDQIRPANGVYAVYITHNNTTYKAMLNIGVKPTVSKELSLTIEAHIFDFDRTIYGEEIAITFVKHLRAEQKFSSIDALKAQLDIDKEHALKALA